MATLTMTTLSMGGVSGPRQVCVCVCDGGEGGGGAKDAVYMYVCVCICAICAYQVQLLKTELLRAMGAIDDLVDANRLNVRPCPLAALAMPTLTMPPLTMATPTMAHGPTYHGDLADAKPRVQPACKAYAPMPMHPCLTELQPLASLSPPLPLPRSLRPQVPMVYA